MKWLSVPFFVALVLTALPVIMGSTSALDVNGGTIQFFNFDVNIEIPFVSAAVDIKPETLQLKSQGQPVNVFIELPPGYSPEKILPDTIRLSYDLNGNGKFEENESIPAESVNRMRSDDYDCDGIPDVRVTFNRAAIIDLLETLVHLDNVTLTVTGRVADRNFVGSDTIKLLH